MFSKRVLESPRYEDWVGEVISPKTARLLRDGLTPRPDGSAELYLEGLTKKQYAEVRAFFRRLGVELRVLPPLVDIHDLVEDPEQVLDWVLEQDTAVEVSYHGRTIQLVPA